MILRMLYEPTLSLHPPPRAIPAVVVRAHYALPGGLVIVVVVHQRCHRPPLSPSRGWLLLGAACRQGHPHHCRPPPMQPHQRRRPCRFASSSSPPAIPPPRCRRALSALSIAHGAVMDRHAASMPSLPVRRVKCRSRTRPPRRDMGPLHQRHRHDCRNASVSSLAAGGRPSFASRAAAAGRVTATAARRR
jgi:hypothetical protein